MPCQAGKIADWRFPGIEKLMLRAIRDVQNCSRKEIISSIIQNHESFAALDIDRFLAVRMSAGMAADGNLSSHKRATAGWKTNLWSDHQGRFEILWRARPFQIFRFGNTRRFVDLLLVAFGTF